MRSQYGRAMAAPSGVRRDAVCSFATHNPAPSKRWESANIFHKFNML
jgi:hypothetical protein